MCPLWLEGHKDWNLDSGLKAKSQGWLRPPGQQRNHYVGGITVILQKLKACSTRSLQEGWGCFKSTLSTKLPARRPEQKKVEGKLSGAQLRGAGHKQLA